MQIDNDALHKAQQSIQSELGDISDLPGELAIAIANTYYHFHCIPKERIPTTPKDFETLMVDAADRLATVKFLPSIIASIRELRGDRSSYDYAVSTSIDILKYQMSPDFALNAPESQRKLRRDPNKVREVPDLAIKMGLFRPASHAQSHKHRAKPEPVFFNGQEYFDDRLFVMEVARTTKQTATGGSQYTWAVITRRNVRGYPPTRVDDFESLNEAFRYMHEIAPTTPRASLDGRPPAHPLTLTQYKAWLSESGIAPLQEIESFRRPDVSEGSDVRSKPVVDKFQGIPPEAKSRLIRKLIGERIKRSLFLRWLGDADKLTEAQLLGMPEATIVSIVESHAIMRDAGMSDEQIFSSIERQRIAGGNKPHNTDLLKYVKYRVKLEHPRGKRVEDSFVEMAVTITVAFINDFFRSNSKAKSVTPSTSEDDSHFAMEMPNVEVSRPLVKYRINKSDLTVFYFENPQTVGATDQSMFEFPQYALLADGNAPLAIVRVEQSKFGTSMLCGIRSNGKRYNFGPYSPTSREAFMAKVEQVLLNME
jgi:hypothetical protein